jgi:hypothetical protein
MISPSDDFAVKRATKYDLFERSITDSVTVVRSPLMAMLYIVSRFVNIPASGPPLVFRTNVEVSIAALNVNTTRLVAGETLVDPFAGTVDDTPKPTAVLPVV